MNFILGAFDGIRTIINVRNDMAVYIKQFSVHRSSLSTFPVISQAALFFFAAVLFPEDFPSDEEAWLLSDFFSALSVLPVSL